MPNQYTVKREFKYKGDVLYIKCTKCGERLLKDDYAKDHNNKLGVRSICKSCMREIYSRTKEYKNIKIKEYYKNNKDKIKERVTKKAISHTNELGFNWGSFHWKANDYALRNGLKPKVCPLCGRQNKIEIHHPSYDNFDMWSVVVFCCKFCHKNIHEGNIECPRPINLLDMECKSPLKDVD